MAELPEFVHLFAKRGKPERSPGLLEESFSSQSKAPRAASLLDPKRSQAVAILLRSIHLRMEDICEAIVTLDSSLVDTESIRALRDNVSGEGKGRKGRAPVFSNECECGVCVHLGICVYVCAWCV